MIQHHRRLHIFALEFVSKLPGLWNKKNTNVRLAKKKEKRYNTTRPTSYRFVWSLTRKTLFHTHLFRKQPSFWRGPLCWPRETRVYQSEGPGGWFEASLRRSCRTGCRWPKRQPALCQLQTVTLEAVKGKRSIQCLWTSTITRWQRCYHSMRTIWTIDRKGKVIQGLNQWTSKILITKWVSQYLYNNESSFYVLWDEYKWWISIVWEQY